MKHRTFDEQIANFNRVVSSWDINQEYKVALLGMIASLGYEHEKSITSEPHWIPVTERPDKSGDYLATLIDGAEKWVEIIYWNETFGGSWQAVIGDEEYYSTIGNVIAWMPLPESYRGE